MTDTLTPRQRKQVAGMITRAEEVKNWPLPLGNTGFSYGGSEVVTDLTLVAQSVGAAGRVGEQIRFHDLDLRYACTVADTYNHCRIIIFQWFVDTAVLNPTAAYIMDVNAVSTTAYTYEAPYNSVQPERFRILYDSQFHVTGSGGATDPIQQGTTRTAHVQIYANRVKNPITFNGAATSGMNHVFLLAISDSAIASHPLISYGGFMNYIDA